MLRSILLSGIGLALVGLARFGFSTIAINVFGPEPSGLLNIALSMAMLAAMPVTAGFGATTLRFIAEARGKGREDTVDWLFRVLSLSVLIMGAAMTVLMIVYRFELASWRDLDAPLVLDAAWLALAYGLYQFTRACLYALGRIGFYTLLEAVAGVVFFLTLGLIAITGDSDHALAAFIVGYGTFTVAAAWSERGRLLKWTTPAERPSTSEILRYFGLGLLGTTASLSIRELSILLAPKVTDLVGVANLGLCISLLVPLQFMPRMLRAVVTAHSAEGYGRGETEEVARSVGEISQWLIVTNIPICVSVMLLAEPLIGFLGGQASATHVDMLQLLTIAACIEIIATPSTNALAGIGRVGITAGPAVLGVFGAGLVWWLTAESLGLVGIALGLLTSSVIKCVIPMAAARTAMGLRVTRTPGLVFGFVVISIACIALREQWGTPFIATGLYLSLIAFVGRKAWMELADFLRERRRARSLS